MRQNFRMIDVGEKNTTRRRAVAKGSIFMCKKTIEMIRKGDSPKGNILAIAEVAGIMSAKNTSAILPLCHPLLLDSVKVWFEISDDHVDGYCEVICSAKTGVEMEALVGINTTLLTIYDLAKAVDPVIEIQNVHLQTKEGGKSGHWQHPKYTQDTKPQSEPTQMNYSGIRFSVGTLSDRASVGTYEDKSGPIIRTYCKNKGADEVIYKIIPDDKKALEELVKVASLEKTDVLLLTGGTGLSKRDITPEVIRSLASKELAAFGEYQRQYGSQFTKSAWLSRSTAFVVNETLFVLFPGSPKAVEQGLACVGDLIPHAIKMIKGESH